MDKQVSNKYTIKEIKEILEMAMYDIEAFIPTDVTEQIIQHLTEYQHMKIAESWDIYPEAFY